MNSNFSNFSTRYRNLLPIFSILVLAAFLRLYKISQYMTFLGDEGRDVMVVRNILQGKFTLLGPTASVGGFFLGPIYYYFMAPFLLLFGYNPVGPAVMVAIFGIATVWLIYRIGKEFFNERAGLVCAFLYALSPLVVAYSRSSWNPNPMPFFSLLFIYFLYKATEQKKTLYFLVSGFFLGIAMQLHYLAVFLAAVVIFYIFLSKLIKTSKNIWSFIKNIFGQYSLVFFGFILGWSPFLAFELRHGFPNTKSIYQFVFRSSDTGFAGNYSIILQDVFFRLFARLVGNFPPPEQVSLKNNMIFIWHHFILYLGLVSLGFFIFQTLNQYKKKTQFNKYLIVSCWFLTGVGLFAFYRKPIYDYYFGFMFALPFFLVGNLISSLWQKPGLARLVSVVIFLVLVGLNIKGIPFRHPPNRQLDQVKGIARFVFDKTEGKPFNFALITGGNSDHAYRYFFELWDNPPVTIETFEKDPDRKTVTDRLFVICETPCSPLGHPLWEIAGFGQATISGKWDVSVVSLYKLDHYRE